MHNISKIFPAVKKSESQDIFLPSDSSASETVKAEKFTEEELPVDLNVEKNKFGEIRPQPLNNLQVRAIDSTAFNLGTVEDGVVGVVRISVIIKKPNESKRYCEKYGPNIFKVTNQDKNSIYQDKFQQVFGTKPPANSAPATYKMIDRIRNLAERYIILEEVKNSTNALILIDGSLISHPVDTPGSLGAITSTGGFSGTASLASGLTGTPSIVVQDITAEMVSIAGTMQYEDVVSVDSVGIVTAREGIRIGTGGTVGPSASGIVTYYGDGSALTTLNADNIASGIVTSARLGASPTATTFLRGDGQFATAGGATVQSGSWTPAWTGHSGTPSAVDTAYGKYTRIGELVFIECYIKSGTRGSASGAIRVGGLPFDRTNDTHDQVLGSVAWDYSGSSIDYSGQNRADHVNMIAWIPNNTGYIRFAHQTSAGDTAYRANSAGSTDLNWIICGNSSGNYLSFRFSGCYRTDA